MNKIFLSIISLFSIFVQLHAQVKLITSDFTDLLKDKSFNAIGVHDPSIFYDEKSDTYYIYGTHYSGAKTKDFRNWTRVANYYNTSQATAFNSCKTRKTMRCLPGKTEQTEVTIPSYNAKEFCSIYGDPNNHINGNMWAPDIIYNPHMGKYCLYLSLNGDHWASVIVLMTSDKVEGPYTYQGPVVFGGFNNQSYDGKKVDYKKTDLEVVLGTQSKIPSRYVTDRWGSYYPNCIDPCVLFDDKGELWMSYGSWSGGIFMLKLDKNTGFRDYTYTYTGTGTSPDANATSDAYFGKKIAGGYYVSGEGSYIQKIGKYYFLFMTYGGLESNKGYEMRVFRSENLLGPYKDAGNQSAIFSSYQLNYGPRAGTNRGMKLIGSMNNWGKMTVAECAQGHNSATVDKEGRNMLFFHTRFNNGNEGFQVRSYQMYLNKSGWLCTAPFQFYNETTTDADIENSQPYSVTDVIGDYHVIIHPYKLDHENYQASTPKLITLGEDGKVTGDYTGTWKYVEEGKSYISITLKNVNGVSSSTFDGVVVEQTMENTTIKTLCFTTVCSTSGNGNVGVPLWGYKYQPKYALAYNYQNNTDYFKATTFSSISKNVDMMFNTTENVELNWKSTDPDVVSETGKYNPKDEDVKMTLTATLSCGNYYWTRDFTATAKAGGEVLGDQKTGLVAYYNFDGKPTANLYNDSERITYSKVGSGIAPVLEEDWSRFGQVVHQTFGPQGANSFSRMPNPLLGQNMDGFTVSMWVKRSDDNAYDALWSFFNQMSSAAKDARFFLTGNAHLAYNDNGGDAANWFDINHPDTKKTSLIKQKEWHLVTVTVSKDNGCTLYVDGASKIKKTSTLNCSFNGSATKDAFDYGKVVSFVSSAKYFYLGLGSFWGSADASFDDLMIYNRELTADDVKGLSTLLNRVNDFSPSATSISEVLEHAASSANQAIYDLQGRKVINPSRGIYIINGKKVYMK